jgi:hypothetical protein
MKEQDWGLSVGVWDNKADKGYMGVNSDEWPPVASSTELI